MEPAQRGAKRKCPTCDTIALLPRGKVSRIHPYAQFLYDVRETLQMPYATHREHIDDLTVGPDSRLARFLTAVKLPFSEDVKRFDKFVAMRPITYRDIGYTGCLYPGFVISKFTFGSVWKPCLARSGFGVVHPAGSDISETVTAAFRRARAGGTALESLELPSQVDEHLNIFPNSVVRISDGDQLDDWMPTVHADTWVMQISPTGDAVITRLISPASLGRVRILKDFKKAGVREPPRSIANASPPPPDPDVPVPFPAATLEDEMSSRLRVTVETLPVCDACAYPPPTVRVQEVDTSPVTRTGGM